MLRRVGALRSTYVGEALNSEIYLPLSGSLIIADDRSIARRFYFFGYFAKLSLNSVIIRPIISLNIYQVSNFSLGIKNQGGKAPP